MEQLRFYPYRGDPQPFSRRRKEAGEPLHQERGRPGREPPNVAWAAYFKISGPEGNFSAQLPFPPHNLVPYFSATIDSFIFSNLSNIFRNITGNVCKILRLFEKHKNTFLGDFSKTFFFHFLVRSDISTNSLQMGTLTHANANEYPESSWIKIDLLSSKEEPHELCNSPTNCANTNFIIFKRNILVFRRTLNED